MTNQINLSETEVGLARYEMDNLMLEHSTLQECLIVVSGPAPDGELCVLAGATTYLPPETAKALAVEILKRLGVKPMELEY